MDARAKDYWRLISYDVDPVWDEYRVPNTATTAPPPAPMEYTTASADLIGGATKFLTAWLVKQDLEEASQLPLRKVRRVPEAQQRFRPT